MALLLRWMRMRGTGDEMPPRTNVPFALGEGGEVALTVLKGTEDLNILL